MLTITKTDGTTVTIAPLPCLPRVAKAVPVECPVCSATPCIAPRFCPGSSQ